jgi:hypothetical protein
MPTLFGQGWPFGVASDVTFEITGMDTEPVVLLAAISHMIQLWYISQNPKKSNQNLEGRYNPIYNEVSMFIMNWVC